ncbi:K(+)/H(+) antiporter [Coccidioides posadasii str. Silveira]|uniref:K(+)/H(+) antiporter n=1 Tax=Coccidioides posadasii (strain RMSCC 757 / Silveira) TaxID=443226 RepID=UPI001BED6FB6|nr:K(+)/H(+) antiporter [Coccidioides posadasii str. Silveira]
MALVVAQTGTVGGSAAPAAPTNRATPQGGIFDRLNPSQYDPKNPLTLFIIQVKCNRQARTGGGGYTLAFY